MKYVIAFLTIILLSCNKDEDIITSSEVLGTWRLIETLRDPGDGSGTYNPVTSGQTLTFMATGNIVSNSEFCQLNDEVTGTYIGTFTLEENDKEGVITSPDCVDFNLSFEIEDDNLIIYYPCFEPCGDKYIKAASE